MQNKLFALHAYRRCNPVCCSCCAERGVPTIRRRILRPTSAEYVRVLRGSCETVNFKPSRQRLVRGAGPRTPHHLDRRILPDAAEDVTFDVQVRHGWWSCSSFPKETRQKLGGRAVRASVSTCAKLDKTVQVCTILHNTVKTLITHEPRC